MNVSERVKEIKTYYEDRYVPEDMGPSRRSPKTYNVFLEWAGVAENSRILDVACGAGPLLLAAGENFDRWGVDLSERAIRVTSFLAPGARLTVGDMQRLAFVDGSFDAVFNIGGLEHAPDMRSAIKEMTRVCAPNGILCFVVPNANFFWYRVFRLEGTQQREMEEHLLTLDGWQKLLAEANLRILLTGRDPGPDVRSDFGLRAWLRGMVRRVALTLTHLLPIFYTYQFVFICQQQGLEAVTSAPSRLQEDRSLAHG